MAVYLSCGHREDNFSKHYSIMTKQWSKDNRKAVGYKTVCLSCRRAYAKERLLLLSDSDAMEWLRS